TADEPVARPRWLDVPDDEAVDWYDELDAERWSIRCVRRFRDGSWKALSYGDLDRRWQMPEAPIPPLDQIYDSPEFRAQRFRRPSSSRSGSEQHTTARNSCADWSPRRRKPMIEGSCHCGAVRWTFEGVPESATACNCTACRRYGVLWAYDYEGE